MQPHASQGSDAVVAALRSRMAALVGYPEAALEPLQADPNLSPSPSSNPNPNPNPYNYP